MNKGILFYWGLLFFSLPLVLQAQTEEELRRYIENIIYHDTKIVYEQTPGFIVGVIVGDSSYVYSYGSQSKTEAIPITDSTLFELGGASKVFSASLLELLVQEGEMHYDSSLATYLEPQTKVSPSLLDLITHTSGLPRMPTDFGVHELEIRNPYAHYSKTDLLKFYEEYSFQNSTQKYDYSHLAYGLLELAMEQKTGLSFEEGLQQYLLRPYRFKDTVHNLKSTDNQQLAMGYSLIGESASPWSSPAFLGAVGLQSSMRDLLQLIRLQTDKNLFDGMHQTMERTPVDKNSYTGKGWHVLRPKRYFDVVLHSGSTAGHRIFLGFVKETKTGVIVLSNSKAGTKGLGYLTLKMLNNNFKKTSEQKKLGRKKK